MVRAIVAGAAGRMGGRIIHNILNSEGIEVAAAFEAPGHPAIGKDAGEVAGAGNIGVAVAGSLEEVIAAGDVVIDFTHHTTTLGHVRVAAENGKCLVVGTTGHSEEELSAIREDAPKTPCVMAPNMSTGVNLMFKMAAKIAEVISGFDIEIIEAHHNLKKDAPSGTAVKLGKVIADAVGRDYEQAAVFARHGIIGERTKEEIGIQTIRAGDIVGEHTVIYAGVGERLEFTHRAHSRDTFASGAIRAALWVVNQPPGLYDMADVLGLS